MPRGGDDLRRMFELQSWALMLVVLSLPCNLTEKSACSVVFSTILQEGLHKGMKIFFFPPIFCKHKSQKKKKKRERSLKSHYQEIFSQAGPTMGLTPTSKKACWSSWAKLFLSAFSHSHSSVLVGSFSPQSCSYTPGQKHTMLAEHHASEMVPLPSATL